MNHFSHAKRAIRHCQSAVCQIAYMCTCAVRKSGFEFYAHSLFARGYCTLYILPLLGIYFSLIICRSTPHDHRPSSSCSVTNINGIYHGHFASIRFRIRLFYESWCVCVSAFPYRYTGHRLHVKSTSRAHVNTLIANTVVGALVWHLNVIVNTANTRNAIKILRLTRRARDDNIIDVLFIKYNVVFLFFLVTFFKGCSFKCYCAPHVIIDWSTRLNRYLR